MFSIQKLPDKGLGLVATQKFAPGEVVLIESPLISISLNKNGDLEGNLDKETEEFHCSQLDQALLQKSDQDLHEYFSLCDTFSPEGTKTSFGIIKTNSFSVPQGDGTSLMLFPTIARINHSCAPNCHHYWTGKTQSFVVRAVQTIWPGEEITISYMSPLQRSDFHDKASRQEILRTDFGFECFCHLCQMKNHDDDDAKRRRLLEIESLWTDLGTNPDLALEFSQEQLELCQELQIQPGLSSYVALHCVEAASLMVSKKINCLEVEIYRELSVDFAKKAQDFGKLAYGEDSEEYEIFQIVLRVCQTSCNSDLLLEIQQSITALREIDS